MLARAKMDSICSLVTDGTHDSPKLQPSGVPFIKGKHISQGYIDFANCDFITEADHADACRRVKPRIGDVLFSNIGSVGDTARVSVNREFSIKNVALFRPDPAKVDPRYFYYLVVNPRFKESMLSLRSGSAQPFITLGSLRGYETTFHIDRDQQRRIASILSAYDDLIENNTRRIAVLEEMARRIYEEWFVRFRFPGHEGLRMVESELGLVPDGWRAAALGDIAAYINRGLAPKYDDAAASIVINQKCIRDQRLNLGEARKQGKPVPAEKFVRLGDVLINSTGVGTLGRVAQVLEAIDNCTVDTHVSIVRPGKDCDPDFFGLTLLAQQAHFEAQGVGSTGQTELSRGRIAETSVVVPPLAVQRAFGKVVQPMRRLTVTLQNKNLNLRTTRDLLLPKLISGELDVSAVAEPEALAA